MMKAPANERVENYLDQWEELRESGLVATPDEFMARYVGSGTLTGSERVELESKLAGLVRMDKRLSFFRNGDRTPLLTSQFLQSESLISGRDPVFFRLEKGLEVVPGYFLEERLGRGGAAEVWKGTGPGAREMALKIIPNHGRTARIERDSLEVVRSVHHANLLSIFGIWEQPDYMVIATALADETLMDRYERASGSGRTGLTSGELLPLFQEVGKVLDYINQEDDSPASGHPAISHGDVKPQNILLAGGSVLLGDLGTARVLRPSGLTRHSGSLTTAFAAPECLLGGMTGSSDQYSLAATWFFLRFGRLPFRPRAGELPCGSSRELDLSLAPFRERCVLEKALSCDPGQRWPCSGDLVCQLERACRRDACRLRMVCGLVIARKIAFAVLVLVLMGVLFFYLPERYWTRYDRRAAHAEAMGNLQVALEQGTKAVEYRPRSVASRLRRSRLALANGFLYLARNDALTLLQWNPEEAEALFLLGQIAFRQEREEEAIRFFDAALRFSPNEGKYYLARSDVWRAVGNREKAALDAGRAVELLPNDAEAYLARGLTVASPESAREDLTRAIRMAPRRAEFYLERSLFFLGEGEYAYALADTEAAVRLNPELGRTWLIRAEIRERMGQPIQAEEEMAKGITCLQRDH